MAKDEPKKDVSISINLDTTQILYTDNIHITVSNSGVVMDVTQRIGNQVRIVSRVGMSREHAKNFAKELGKLLIMTEGTGKTDKKN